MVNKCNKIWCKDRYHKIQELELWYQMLPAGIQTTRMAWLRFGFGSAWTDRKDGRRYDRLGGGDGGMGRPACTWFKDESFYEFYDFYMKNRK